MKKTEKFGRFNILFGSNPLETKETIKKTLEGIKKVNPDQVMFNVYSLFPGTEFYDLAKNNNWIVGAISDFI